MSKYRLTPQEWVSVRVRTPELLECEVSIAPGGHRPPAHRHPAQDEHFEVLEGTLSVGVGDSAVTVGAGETLDVPRGVAHTIAAGGEHPVRAIWQTRPALRTEAWWASLDEAIRHSRNGRVALPVLARLVRAHRNEFEPAFPLAGPVLRALAMVPARSRR
jgi:mannose-6-phosphate isomerase-like protein (cupin superfamily)